MNKESNLKINNLVRIIVAVSMVTVSLISSGSIAVAAPSGSISFNGSQSISYATTAIGNSSTTIEFWMNPAAGNATNGLSRVVSTQYSFGAGVITMRMTNNCLGTGLTINNQVMGQTDGQFCFTSGTWYHVALVGEASSPDYNWSLYINGTKRYYLTRTTSTENITNTRIDIGADQGREGFIGNVANFRYVRGSAVYTSAFTPQNPPLSVITGTQLLLNTEYDGTLNTAKADTSGNNLAGTASGTPTASISTPYLTPSSITNFTVPTLVPAQVATLSATSSVAGAVTFLAGGSAITGCTSVSTNGSNTATCSYTPTNTTPVTFTLNFTPTSGSYSSLTGVNSTTVTPGYLTSSITNFTVPALIPSQAATLSATSNVAGAVTFLAGGSAITGCTSVSTNGSNTSTCSYTPPNTNPVTFTLNFTPTSASYSSLTGVSSTTVTPGYLTPALALSFPNSNTAEFLADQTITATYSNSGDGSLTFSTSASNSICIVNSTTGVVTQKGSGSCPVTISSAQGSTYAAGSLTVTLTISSLPASNDQSQVAAQAAAQAAVNAEAARKAKEQQELKEILALIPKIGELTLSLGETTRSLYSTKCVKGKTTKSVKNGAKCPKGFKKK
jgi:hypothetical protein